MVYSTTPQNISACRVVDTIWHFNWNIAFGKASWDIRFVMLRFQVINVLVFHYIEAKHS